MLLEGTRRITDMRHAIDIRHSEWQLRLGKKNFQQSERMRK